MPTTVAGRPRVKDCRRDARRARESVERRVFPQALRLALVMVDESDEALRIARRAIREALGQKEPIPASPHTAVLEAVQRLASTRARGRSSRHALSADERMARAVSELCDGQGLSHRAIARTLCTTSNEVTRLHALAQQAAGVEAASPPRCGGWSLVRRYDALCDGEVAAADRHVDLCRDCRHAHAARLATRARLRKALPIVSGGFLAAGTAGGAWLIFGGAVAGIVGVGALFTTALRPTVEADDAPTPTRAPSSVVAPSLSPRIEVAPPLGVLETLPPVPQGTSGPTSTASAVAPTTAVEPSTIPNLAPVGPPPIPTPASPIVEPPPIPRMTPPDATPPAAPLTLPALTLPPLTVTLPDLTLPDLTLPDLTLPDLTVPLLPLPLVTLPDLTLTVSPPPVPAVTAPSLTVPVRTAG